MVTEETKSLLIAGMADRDAQREPKTSGVQKSRAEFIGRLNVTKGVGATSSEGFLVFRGFAVYSVIAKIYRSSVEICGGPTRLSVDANTSLGGPV